MCESAAKNGKYFSHGHGQWTPGAETATQEPFFCWSMFNENVARTSIWWPLGYYIEQFRTRLWASMRQSAFIDSHSENQS